MVDPVWGIKTMTLASAILRHHDGIIDVRPVWPLRETAVSMQDSFTKHWFEIAAAIVAILFAAPLAWVCHETYEIHGAVGANSTHLGDLDQRLDRFDKRLDTFERKVPALATNRLHEQVQLAIIATKPTATATGSVSAIHVLDAQTQRQATWLVKNEDPAKLTALLDEVTAGGDGRVLSLKEAQKLSADAQQPFITPAYVDGSISFVFNSSVDNYRALISQDLGKPRTRKLSFRMENTQQLVQELQANPQRYDLAVKKHSG